MGTDHKPSKTVIRNLGKHHQRPSSRSPYERAHGLSGNQDTLNIVLSSSELPLAGLDGSVASRRLAGEEVRFIDLPASEPGARGIFDNLDSSNRSASEQKMKKL